MQSVRRKQEQLVKQEQSLQMIKSLLSSGFGFITYYRGILPENNFVDGYISNNALTPPDPSQLSLRPNQASVKIIKPGVSAAGNKLLDYLEGGIFDAIEKQYLKSFMFAVYLDPQHPENIIECFTFSFSYHTIPGTQVVIPIFTGLRDDTPNRSFSKTPGKPSAQQQVEIGKVPTLGEVQHSIKTLLRLLTLTAQHNDPVPPKHYVTFKLFYNDGTPEDYEPPFFRPADSKDDRFHFATHDIEEQPLKMSIGSLNTSFHGVKVDFASVSDFIPSRHEYAKRLPINAQGVDSQDLSDEQLTARHLEDALSRRVVWDAEEPTTTHGGFPDRATEPLTDFQGPAGNVSNERALGALNQNGPIAPLLEAFSDIEIEQAVPGDGQESDSDFHSQFDRPSQVKPTPLILSPSLLPPSTINSGKHCCCNLKPRSKRDGEASNEWCQCEGSCKKWYHVWCMGYTSSRAFRAQHPDAGTSFRPWVCFECRLRENPLATLLSEEDVQTRVSNFKDIALFRFTLRLVIESGNLPDCPSALGNRLGCAGSTAFSLWQSLEDKGFIARVRDVTSSQSDLGNSHYRNGQKHRSTQITRTATRGKYEITAPRVRQANMAAYFEGSNKMEETLMGLKELRRDVRLDKKRKKACDDEAAVADDSRPDPDSQTLLEANALPPSPWSPNISKQQKKLRTYSERPEKKLKVSLAQRAICSVG
ncbi:DNA-binding protein [Calocera viscosa TUFC12733]|uniref:DNA-binding protein n=1 Tax=Calocera viscosa (strain TUFC12733) TaxID=1330018 RepID=A0A167RQ40_CALVF|nr:DNA-binding protein [Calocera viscosa TUFC12733]